MTTRSPRTRADAARNQRVLLDAAARTFAEFGLDVPVSQIVQDAGLGKGTAFRCFATKSLLVAAIVQERLEELVEQAESQLEAEDPGEALYEVLRNVAALYAHDRGFAQGMAGDSLEQPGVRAAYGRLLDVTGRLVWRAQRDGALRTDVTAVDVLLLQSAVSHAAGPLLSVDDRFWERYLDLVFDGLRPQAARRAARRAPTRAEFELSWTATTPDR